jgi:uncharacterized Zn finger protein
MSLEPKIETRVRSHLRHIGALKPCPVCSEAEWVVADVVMHAVLAPSARGVDPTRSVPVLLVECENCGHLVSFNAEKVPGLLPSGSGEHG